MSPVPPAIDLTVIICTYNNADCLAQALTHLAAQTVLAGRSVPILVIDNNCTDHTAAVIAEYTSRLPGLRRIVEPQQGLVFARRRAVEESATEWLAFIDDDNYLDPLWIECALSFAEAHPECGAFGGRVNLLWETTPPPLFVDVSYAFAGLDLGPAARLLEGEMRWRLVGAGLVCRKSALAQAGWLDWQLCVGRSGSSAMAGDDLEMVMRIARAGYKIGYQPACSMQHFISARRINDAYLVKLHKGFGLAHPLLLGMKRRRSFPRWCLAFLRSVGGMLRHILRLAWQGMRHPLKMQEARLRLAYFSGALAGLRSIGRLTPKARKIWLGSNGGETSEHGDSPSATQCDHARFV